MDGISAIRRWWWALLLGGVTAGAVTYALASTASPTYTSEVRLLVGPVSADKDILEASGKLARTYADLAVSRPVLEDAVRSSNATTTVDDLAEATTTTSNDVSRLVSVTVEDSDAQAAANLANAISRRLTSISTTTPAPDTASVDALVRQPEVVRLEARARAGVQNAAKRVLTHAPAGRLQVVEPARPAPDPSAPRVPLLTLMGGFAGFLAALVLVFLRGSAREEMDPADVLTKAGPPFLGRLEAARHDQPYRGHIVRERPDSVAAARYRTAAARIGLLNSPSPVRSLLVVDVGDGRAAAVVAANLGAAVWEMGREVVLVDGSPSNGGLTRLHGLDPERSYIELIEEGARLVDNGRLLDDLAVRQDDGLYVLPSSTSDRLRFIDAAEASAVLRAVYRRDSAVVVSAPPVDRSPATLSWAAAVDATIVVVDTGRTSSSSVDEIVDVLTRAAGHLAGIVLVEPPPRWRVPRRAARRPVPA